MAFSYVSPLTVTNSSTLLPSTQTNFPVLILITDNRLKTVANSGNVSSSSGFDIRPYSDAALTSAMTFQLVSYDGTAGTVEMWVNVPSLALSTVFYLAYGNPSLTSDGSSTATWDSNFKTIYHMKDASSPATDATSNGNSATQSGGVTFGATGQIGKATSYASASSQKLAPSVTNLQGTTYTYSAWANVSTNPVAAGRKVVLEIGDNTDKDQVLLVANAASGLTGWAFISWNTDGTAPSNSVGSLPTTGTWYYLTLVRNGSTDIRLYVNAALISTDSTVGKTASFGASPSAWIGARNTSLFFDGSIDEVRISNIARSADWITAEYNNQLNPTTFLTLGTETFLDPPTTVDFPNPRAPGFPRENITFLQPLDLFLLSKDKFFDGAGQGPNFDWPVPKGKPYPVDIRTWIQTLALNLRSKDKFFRAPGQGPTYDYPNPSGKPYPIEVRTWLQSVALNLLGKDKFFGPAGNPPDYDWPNPNRPRRGIDLYTFTQQFNPNLQIIAPPRPPINQTEWPNPFIPRRNPEFSLSTNPNVYQSGKPIKQNDHPNPIPYRRPVQDWIQQTVLNLLVPFNQDDWPNPRGYPPRPSFTLATNPAIYPSGKPFHQDDYPNPRAASRAIELLSQTGSINPNLTVIVVAAVPFNQDDWPNPQAPRRKVEDWIRPTNPTIYQSGKPFLQTDWPIPTRAIVRRPDWTEITDPNRYASGKPFKLDDWQNPLGPRRKPDLSNFLLPRNFDFFPPFMDQFVVQDTPTIADILGVYNSAFLLLAAQSTASNSQQLTTDATILAARNTTETVQNSGTKLKIFTSNDREVGS